MKIEYIVNAEEEKLFYGDKYERLIRCKDCEHRIEWDVGNHFYVCDIFHHSPTNDGFCKWAKMKGDAK